MKSSGQVFPFSVYSVYSVVLPAFEAIGPPLSHVFTI